MLHPKPTADSENHAALCASCRHQGRRVKPVTLESLLTEQAKTRATTFEGFYFCAEAGCDVAYFQPESGERFVRTDVRVRIGLKETESPRPICYCFDHTFEEIQAEVGSSGSSKIADDITAKCRQGLDRCEEANPKGSCCLGDVRRAVRELQARLDGALAVPPQDTSPEAAADCCEVSAASDTSSEPGNGNAGIWVAGGAVVSAIFSSACCWLPLLLIAFGASAAGVAGFFEAYRPYLLVVTGLLLAGGFYLVYFRKEQCAPGDACAVPNSKLSRFNKIMLWVATAAVLGFTFFPSYVGKVVGSSGSNMAGSRTSAGVMRLYRVEGMTCEGCALPLQAQLASLGCVEAVEVSYEDKLARLIVQPRGASVAHEIILAAIREAGYEGHLVREE